MGADFTLPLSRGDVSSKRVNPVERYYCDEESDFEDRREMSTLVMVFRCELDSMQESMLSSLPQILVLFLLQTGIELAKAETNSLIRLPH
ncbi:hypothetical protein PF007_g24634 [Phytophthora fragariae]|uniref:Uncharacterized protein n=1 Tax=Phytophthora fragariae TaxID=53985 RepID=A0A6A3R1W2_9STRA|nr:hypothetical protein PF009_g27417 [Phytophthora fragariae]KAE9076407.1 hypothetical protein PF007_g24634 [Phytophthora fragariae]KAE9085498.1 hypothetical protein PF006_g26244 [Phytophthora fragariae]KAE9187528.1 hypothetical protein PF004_g22770 [Phytophthora fragariae]KAE9315607.1 hypothetical protein PF008_g19202 [Phytophthora fragariae]